MKRRRLLILLVFGFVAGVFFNTQSKKPEREPNFSIKAKKIINVKPAVLSKRKPVSKIEFPHKPDVQPRAKALDEDMTSSLTINPAALRRRGHEEAMGDLMKERMSYLRRQCNATNAKQVKAAYKWSKRVVLRATGFFSVCATPKGGSTSWRHLTWRMPDDVVGRSPSLHILNVRHPLARLASAYRDKYLGGLPLYKYDQEWRERIKSRMPWSNEWETFWFPALAFRGAFPLRPNLRLRARNATYWANVDQGGMIYRVLRNYYGKSAFGLRYHFRNASFTFEDFLRYVVWTHDVGYMNKHWAPLVFLCNPCKHRYDFIVHLETIAPEFNYIMTFLNHTEGIQMEEQHKTKATNRSDIHLYKDIPRDVMKRILEIYKFDFELFGYRYPFQ